MEALFAHAISPVNMPYTILLGLSMAYWLFVIIGALDLDTFDIDLDMDVDGDLDFEGIGMGVQSLVFLNIGLVPITVWVSVFAIVSWVLSIVGQSLFMDLVANDFGNMVKLALGAAVIFPVSAVITKVMTSPLKKVFRKKKAETHEDYIGQTMVVTTTTVSEDFGQATITKDGNPLILNVRSQSSEQLKKGDSVTVISVDKTKNTYEVTRSLSAINSTNKPQPAVNR